MNQGSIPRKEAEQRPGTSRRKSPYAAMTNEYRIDDDAFAKWATLAPSGEAPGAGAGPAMPGIPASPAGRQGGRKADDLAVASTEPPQKAEATLPSYPPPRIPLQRSDVALVPGPTTPTFHQHASDMPRDGHASLVEPNASICGTLPSSLLPHDDESAQLSRDDADQLLARLAGKAKQAAAAALSASRAGTTAPLLPRLTTELGDTIQGSSADMGEIGGVVGVKVAPSRQLVAPPAPQVFGHTNGHGGGVVAGGESEDESSAAAGIKVTPTALTVAAASPTTRAREGGEGVRLAHLCKEDKAKVARLVQDLVKLRGEKAENKARFERLRAQNEAIVQEVASLRVKFGQSMQLLRKYQNMVHEGEAAGGGGSTSAWAAHAGQGEDVENASLTSWPTAPAPAATSEVATSTMSTTGTARGDSGGGGDSKEEELQKLRKALESEGETSRRAKAEADLERAKRETLAEELSRLQSDLADARRESVRKTATTGARFGVLPEDEVANAPGVPEITAAEVLVGRKHAEPREDDGGEAASQCGRDQDHQPHGAVAKVVASSVPSGEHPDRAAAPESLDCSQRQRQQQQQQQQQHGTRLDRGLRLGGREVFPADADGARGPGVGESIPAAALAALQEQVEKLKQELAMVGVRQLALAGVPLGSGALFDLEDNARQPALDGISGRNQSRSHGEDNQSGSLSLAARVDQTPSPKDRFPSWQRRRGEAGAGGTGSNGDRRVGNDDERWKDGRTGGDGSIGLLPGRSASDDVESERLAGRSGVPPDPGRPEHVPGRGDGATAEPLSSDEEGVGWWARSADELLLRSGNARELDVEEGGQGGVNVSPSSSLSLSGGSGGNRGGGTRRRENLRVSWSSASDQSVDGGSTASHVPPSLAGGGGLVIDAAPATVDPPVRRQKSHPPIGRGDRRLQERSASSTPLYAASPRSDIDPTRRGHGRPRAGRVRHMASPCAADREAVAASARSGNDSGGRVGGRRSPTASLLLGARAGVPRGRAAGGGGTRWSPPGTIEPPAPRNSAAPYTRADDAAALSSSRERIGARVGRNRAPPGEGGADAKNAAAAHGGRGDYRRRPSSTMRCAGREMEGRTGLAQRADANVVVTGDSSGRSGAADASASFGASEAGGRSWAEARKLGTSGRHRGWGASSSGAPDKATVITDHDTMFDGSLLDLIDDLEDTEGDASLPTRAYDAYGSREQPPPTAEFAHAPASNSSDPKPGGNTKRAGARGTSIVGVDERYRPGLISGGYNRSFGRSGSGSGGSRSRADVKDRYGGSSGRLHQSGLSWEENDY